MPSLSFTKNITIFLRNVNDKPRDIRLSNYTVPETAPVNYVIGRFSASDEDKGMFKLHVSLYRNIAVSFEFFCMTLKWVYSQYILMYSWQCLPMDASHLLINLECS